MMTFIGGHEFLNPPDDMPPDQCWFWDGISHCSAELRAHIDPENIAEQLADALNRIEQLDQYIKILRRRVDQLEEPAAYSAHYRSAR